MDATTRSTTPNFLTLAGGDIQIGMLNVSVAMSMGFSVPMGTVRLDHTVLSKYITLKLVQSM